jgi:Flp pilus assembly secretin CpaC
LFALRRRTRNILVAMSALTTFAYGATAGAQVPDRNITRVDLPIGRSFPIETTVPVTRVSVANPEIADVAVIGARDVVINAKAAGETDVIIWGTDVPRRHYRVLVHSPADRQQIVLYVKIAEVRRDFLRNLGVNGLWRDQHTRVGSGLFRTDDPINRTTGEITLGADTHFGSVLTDFGTDRLLAFLDAEEQNGNARTLAEPNIMAAH